METTKSLEVARGAMDDDDHEEAWVHDSSVDHRGRSPARATTGSWKAAMFIIRECCLLLIISFSLDRSSMHVCRPPVAPCRRPVVAVFNFLLPSHARPQ
jgi:hypothetical protein